MSPTAVHDVKIVVTGGAGFIGANLCRRLVKAGDTEVVALDDLSSGSAKNLDELPVQLVVGSVLDPHVLDEALSGAGSVVHLAAIPSVPRSLAAPLASHEANASGTLQVLEAARRADCPHVIVASSSSVYGANPELPKHEGLRPRPLSPYAVSKLATECYALAYGECFGLQTLAFRFFNVFGPLQPAGHAYAAVVPAFVQAALDRRSLPVFGDGLQTRDFTFVDSVTEVLANAVQRGVSCADPVNLAFGSRRTLLELITELEQIIGRDLPREHLSERAADVRDSQADGQLLRSLFPEVSPIPFREALERTVDWFMSG